MNMVWNQRGSRHLVLNEEQQKDDDVKEDAEGKERRKGKIKDKIEKQLLFTAAKG